MNDHEHLSWNRFVRNGDELTRVVSFNGQEYKSTLDTADLNCAGDNHLADWWYAYLRGEKPIAEIHLGPLRVAELFCGSGGLAQGVKQFCQEVGYEFFSVGAIDEDGDAVEIYQQNHGTELDCATKGRVEYLVDFHTKKAKGRTHWHGQPEIINRHWANLTGKNSVDVLLAGPPCQGHSNLNNHTRRQDERNQSYLYVPAVAYALNIPTVIIENVPTVIHDRGEVVQAAQELFEGAGYRVETCVLSAAKLGWPQTRSRFFMVAQKGSTTNSLELVSKSLAIPDGQQPLSALWAIADFEDVRPTDHYMYHKPDYTEENRRRIDHLHDEDQFDLPFELHNSTHQNGTSYSSVYGRMHADQPSGTITTGFLTPGRGRYIHPTRRRTLNPREAARLQGFPDTYRFTVNGKPPTSVQLVKWIGDAVPMPLGYAAAMAAFSARDANDLCSGERRSLLA